MTLLTALEPQVQRSLDDAVRDIAWSPTGRVLALGADGKALLAADGQEVSEAMLQLEAGGAPGNLFEEMEQTERERIAEALAQARGSRTDAAKSLGIPRTTFLNKMKRYGLS